MPKPKRRKFEIKKKQKRREKRVLVTHNITNRRGIDPFTSLKKIISEGFKKKSPGAKQYKLEKAIKQYQEGKISIGKAAENAGISLWEIMDELKERNIVNPLGEEEFAQGLKNLQKVWK